MDGRRPGLTGDNRAAAGTGWQRAEGVGAATQQAGPFPISRPYVPLRRFRFPTRANMVIWTSMERFAMLADPLWLTAVASLVTSVASLVWAVRRKR
jgi:hypothetical protein